MTVRIDTLRNQIAGTTELLRMAHQELEDLHHLAYERPTRNTEKVAGGDPLATGLNLDTHGDPQARTAYRNLSETVATACANIAVATHDALNFLRVGPTPGNGRRHVQLAELGDLIARQERRIQRGEYTPIRRGPQPDRDQALAQLRTQLDTVQRKLDKVTKQRDRLRAKHPDPPPAPGRSTWRRQAR